MISIEVEKLIKEMALPDSFIQTVEAGYYPLAENVFNAFEVHKIHTSQPLMLGVQGVQGCGKSTCSEFLKLVLAQRYGLNSVVISIDDFYLTRNARQELARSMHPLFATRGVPGTHDLSLAETTLLGLLQQTSEQTVEIPRFDKSNDDRCSQADWDVNMRPVAVVIFEGWCIGLPPIAIDGLAQPINSLEAELDSNVKWRTYMAKMLNGEYQQLFGLLDRLLVIQAPSFECVKKWRLLQEQKLRDRLCADGVEHEASNLMSEAQIMQFIQHYERLSEHALKSLPKIADWVMYLDEQHRVVSVNNQADKNKHSGMLVSTDLDGTLLDHYDYSWQAAKPAMRALNSCDIPIILNSSKTMSEVLYLQAAMHLDSPMIVENGSAIFLPKAYVKEVKSKELTQTGGYYCKTFGLDRQQILDVAYALREKKGYDFQGFNDWSINEISVITGLTYEEAERAADKCFSEPIIWHGSDIEFIEFTKQLASQKINVLKGGRFFHLQGQTDKAQPLLWLKSWLKEHHDSTIEQIICLGDNHNDVDMLNVADVAVCVKSPVTGFPQIKNPNIIYTQYLGPIGWNQAVLQLLTQ